MKLLTQLTARELQVLELISLEYTAKEIATLLYISRHTVITHKKHLLLKLHARNCAGLVRKGFEQGYLKLTHSTQKLRNINSPLRSVG